MSNSRKNIQDMVSWLTSQEANEFPLVSCLQNEWETRRDEKKELSKCCGDVK